MNYEEEYVGVQNPLGVTTEVFINFLLLHYHLQVSFRFIYFYKESLFYKR